MKNAKSILCETTWNMTVLGKEISSKIQELCQEYWEAGFNTGKMSSNAENTKSIEEEKHEHTAWCPECFDAMDCVELNDDKGNISKHIYQCFGCNKWFELKEFDIGERAFGNNTKSEMEKEE